MARSFGLPRLAAGLTVIPFAALLANACGGNDVIDVADSSTAADGSLSDAHGAEGSLSDVASSDADAAAMDAEAGQGDAGSRDADATAPDADAATHDADAGAPDADAALDAANDADADAAVSDSGTANLMQSFLTGGPFVVLGAATITNSGINTVLIGDIGTTGPAITGLTGHPFQPSGTTEINNARAGQALTEVGTAYTTLTGRPCPPANDLTGMDLGGKTLAPGVYCFTSSAGQIGSTTLTFDAQGDPNAVWIIQIGTTLTVLDNAKAVIIGGPPSLACRIFWTTGTGATLNGGVQYVGNIVASSLTSMLTGATLSPGRAFGLTAGVTLLDNTISAAACQ